MIVTKGYGAITLITQGYGASKSGIADLIKVEFLRLVAYVRKTLNLRSEL